MEKEPWQVRDGTEGPATQQQRLEQLFPTTLALPGAFVCLLAFHPIDL